MMGREDTLPAQSRLLGGCNIHPGMVGSIKMNKRDEPSTWNNVPELQLEEVKPTPRRSNPELVPATIDPGLLDEFLNVVWKVPGPVQH
jgi:hypothetical protein